MKSTLIILMAVLVLPSIAVAQLSGPLSGTIAAGNYAVTGDISVAADDSLYIEPGTTLRFQGEYGFTVFGYLSAVGAENDSIRFVNDAEVAWNGIWLFHNLPTVDLDRLEYCVVAGCSTSAIKFNQISPRISHCSIRNNATSIDDGAGIHAGFMADATIEHCVIEHNSTSGKGGGIYIESSSPTIVDCVIRNNHAGDGGGGVYIDQWASDSYNATIEDCEIIANTADYHGAGVLVYRGDTTIARSTISANSCPGWIGAAVYGNCDRIESMTTIIEDCVIAGNSGLGAIMMEFDALAAISYCTLSGNIITGGYGAAIGFLETGPSTIVGTIIEGTTGPGLRAVFGLAVSFCDFDANSGGDLYNVLPGFGEITGVNANGDPCDVFMNIFEPPTFVDPENDNYHLQPSSACIDAGDPNSPVDPDGTTADIGAFYHAQSTAVDDTPAPVNVPVLAVYPNPFNPQTTVSFTLPRAGWADVCIYDLTGRQVTSLASRQFAAGQNTLNWIGRDTQGRAVPSGTYIVRLETEGRIESSKVMLVK